MSSKIRTVWCFSLKLLFNQWHMPFNLLSVMVGNYRKFKPFFIPHLIMNAQKTLWKWNITTIREPIVIIVPDGKKNKNIKTSLSNVIIVFMHVCVYMHWVWFDKLMLMWCWKTPISRTSINKLFWWKLVRETSKRRKRRCGFGCLSSTKLGKQTAQLCSFMYLISCSTGTGLSS